MHHTPTTFIHLIYMPSATRSCEIGQNCKWYAPFVGNLPSHTFLNPPKTISTSNNFCIFYFATYNITYTKAKSVVLWWCASVKYVYLWFSSWKSNTKNAPKIQKKGAMWWRLMNTTKLPKNQVQKWSPGGKPEETPRNFKFLFNFAAFVVR